MKTDTLYFLVESGKAREVTEKYIKQYICVMDANHEYIRQFPDVTQYSHNNCSGRINGVIFPNEIPKGFLKADKRGVSYPRSNSKWAKEIAELPKCQDANLLIAHEFSIPLDIKWKNNQGGYGSGSIGNILYACGVMFNDGLDGDIAIWIPDVPKYVERYKNSSFYAAGGIVEVEEPANSFVPNIEGARQISKKEWELLCLQREVAKEKSEVSK